MPIAELYYQRISASLDAFETLSSVFVRAVPGALASVSSVTATESGARVDTTRLTSGVEGVQRLCKALVSARFVEFALRTWGEDVVSNSSYVCVGGMSECSCQFFVELWTEICRDSSLRSKAETCPSLPSPEASEEEAPDSAVFDVLADNYLALASRAEDMIVQQICTEVESMLRPHFATYYSYVTVFTGLVTLYH